MKLNEITVQRHNNIGKFFLNMTDTKLNMDEPEREWFLKYWCQNVVAMPFHTRFKKSYDPKLNMKKNLLMISQGLSENSRNLWGDLEDLKELYFDVDVPKRGHVEFNGELDVSSFEVFTPPPFKFDFLRKGYFTNSRLGKSVRELKDWFPTKSEMLVLQGTGLTDWSKANEVIKECETLSLSYVNVKKGALSFLKIDGLTKILSDDATFQKIINKYLVGSRDLLDCQEELIENGYSEEVASL